MNRLLAAVMSLAATQAAIASPVVASDKGDEGWRQVNGLVTVQCYSMSAYEHYSASAATFPFYAVEFFGGSGFVVRGNRVSARNNVPDFKPPKRLVFVGKELYHAFDVDVNEDEAIQTMQDIFARYNALSCDQKTVVVSREPKDELIACGPGSRIVFGSDPVSELTSARTAANLKYTYKGLSNANDDPPKRKAFKDDSTYEQLGSWKLGTYNACNNFENPATP